jgi:L-gulono-1,4-lactone dehydrogenase
MSERSGRVEHGVRWRNWARDQSCRPAQVARPRSVDELASAIVDARSRGWRVRAVGAGHSFSEIACTDGLQVRLDGLARVLDVDSDSGLVRTQAGVSIGELSRRLDQHGLAMENLGDIDSQSIAGAISTATHGTGARLRNIPAQVVELTLVLADGSTLVCSPDRDDELFRAARVGLGALGVVAEVTLQCVPAFTLRGVDAPMPLDQALDRFEQLALDNDHFEFYVFPYSRVALTRTNNRTDDPPRPRSRVNAYVDDVLLTNRAFGLACRAGRLMPARIPQINRLVTRAAGRRVRVERSAAIFTSPRLVRFTEMEYSLPRERTIDAVRAVLAMIERDRFAVPFPIEVRTVAADDALLSTAAGRDSGFVAVHMFERMDWRPYFHAVEAIMGDLGGRPHWGKRHFQTADALRPRYADWDRFQSVRARLDPEGRFANEWTDRVLGPAGDRAAWQSA